MLRTKLLLVMAAAMILLQAIVWALVVWGEFGDEYERLLARQHRNLMTSATILYATLPEVSVTFREDKIERAETTGFPQFETHDVIDSIGRATNATATIFAFDPATGEFWRRSTNILKPDGTRAVGTELGKDNPVHAYMLRGETFAGEATILGIDYVTIYQPLFDSQTGVVTGILFVGTPKAAMIEAIWASAWEMVFESLATLAATFALLAFLLNQMVLKGLVRIQGTTLALTRGERALDIADRNRGDEIGQIARNLEDLRQNLSAAEAAQARALQTEEAGRQKLAGMLGELDREVSGVVQAVGEGDLSRTITARFDQPELQSLATAVNRLRDRMQGFVGDIGATLRAMAKGDLTQSMPQTYSGAFGDIASDANGALDRLGSVLGQALDAVEDTRGGIAKIDRASHDLGSRVEEQAAALQQTAATMEEMAASVKANATSLAEAETAAVSARDTSHAGSDAATAAVEAVGRIAESSNQIAEILKVIDSIAFQTNLLALNAAVEAARAGDAGKGFAVVANEVGNLARQSSQAAREIGELVTRNQGSVDEGVRMVQGAGGALAKIADEIRRLTDRVTAVSLAGREQSTGIEEVNRAVSGLDQMTQENATLTESAAAQVSAVTAQMARLSDSLAGLRLPGRSSGYRAAA